MRRLFLMLAGIGALGLAASTATAGTLKQADLTVTINGATASFGRTTADGVAGASTSASATLAAGSAFAGMVVHAPIATPTNAAVTTETFALGGNGKIQVAPGGVSVTAPLQGTIGVGNPYGPLITVPLAFGAGTPSNPNVVVRQAHINYIGTVYVTLVGTGWHVGTVTATGLTSAAQAIPDVSAHGSFNLTAKGGGTVTLVTLSRVTASGLVVKHIADPTYLKLTYVPEPASLLLLGAGALGLLAAGRRRGTRST